MQGFLTALTAVVNASFDWLGITLGTIIESPALTTMCVGIPIVGKVVDLIARLIR